MAKMWCEKCYGTGKQQWQQSSQNIPYDEPCESCHGKGYTETEVVEVGKIVEWVDAELDKIFENNQIDEYFSGRMNGMEIVKRKIMGLEE